MQFYQQLFFGCPTVYIGFIILAKTYGILKGAGFGDNYFGYF